MVVVAGFVPSCRGGRPIQVVVQSKWRAQGLVIRPPRVEPTHNVLENEALYRTNSRQYTESDGLLEKGFVAASDCKKVSDMLVNGDGGPVDGLVP